MLSCRSSVLSQMNKTKKDYFFVALQLLLFLCFVFASDLYQFPFPKILQILGLIFSVLGLLIILLAIFQLSDALTPFPSPKSGASLKTNGLYQFVRHPIYTGILIFCFAWTYHTGALSQLLVSVSLYVLFLYKSRYEEERLVQVYGEAYVIYQKRVGRFFPKIG
ncbi:MAG: isoprenylcysteine carboxylmethyltransferase family protein [Bacteroidota bacterium]